MNTSTPEHDELCEADWGSEGQESPCRCADRREIRRPATPEHDESCEIGRRLAREARADGIDPTLLKMRVKRVRQATEALEKVKHTLAAYVSGHAPTHCEHILGEGAPRPCTAAVDGFLLLSCGHHAFLCAYHGSVTLRAVQGGSIDCTKTEPDLHPTPARDVTIEWMSLA